MNVYDRSLKKYSYWKSNFPDEPSCPSDDWSVCHNFLKMQFDAWSVVSVCMMISKVIDTQYEIILILNIMQLFYGFRCL